MPAQYTVGQTLPDGATVVSDDYNVNSDGSTFEQMIDSNGAGTNIFTPSPESIAAQQSILNSLSNLQTLVGNLSAAIAQSQTDLATLSASSDPLAPILSRNIQGSLELAQGLADTLITLQIIAAADLQN